MRMSSRPKASSAWDTMPLAPSQVADSVLGTASPPLAVISLTTLSASAPLRTPMSLTMTRAPFAASRRACSRPRPPPAPETIATLPSRRRGECAGFMRGRRPSVPGVAGHEPGELLEGVGGVEVFPHLDDLAVLDAEDVGVHVLVRLAGCRDPRLQPCA